MTEALPAAPFGASPLMVDNGVMCRICLESTTEDLIAPCRCAGSSKWVHRRCVDRWRSSTVNPRSFTHCSECGFAYRLVLQRSADWEDGARRRRRIIGRIAGNFALSFLLLQTWLCVLAIVIRLFDPNEGLVAFFHLQAFDDSIINKSQHDSFIVTLRHHKATYYLAAVLLSLMLLGMFGTIYSCITACGTDQARSPNLLGSASLGQNCVACCDICCRGTCDCYVCDCEGCATACRGGCSGCDCGNCEACEVGSCECVDGGGALFCLVAVAVIFLVVGIFFAMVFFITYLHRVTQQLIQLRELRELAGEYVVQDLSPFQMGPPPADQEPCAPPQEAMNGTDEEAGGAPSAPPRPAWAPVTDGATQRTLTRDMQAVYGLSYSH